MFLVGLVYVLLLKPYPAEQVDPEKIWPVVQKVGHKYGIKPEFIYAIIMAESSLNPQAATSSSRGLMQVSRVAWETVTKKSFDDAWVWQENIEIGTRYLAHCKTFLEQHGRFSYARLAACYHLGPSELKVCRWQMACLPEPKNSIYRKLYNGDLHPVELPKTTG